MKEYFEWSLEVKEFGRVGEVAVQRKQREERGRIGDREGENRWYNFRRENTVESIYDLRVMEIVEQLRRSTLANWGSVGLDAELPALTFARLGANVPDPTRP